MHVCLFIAPQQSSINTNNADTSASINIFVTLTSFPPDTAAGTATQTDNGWCWSAEQNDHARQHQDRTHSNSNISNIAADQESQSQNARNKTPQHVWATPSSATTTAPPWIDITGAVSNNGNGNHDMQATTQQRNVDCQSQLWNRPWERWPWLPTMLDACHPCRGIYITRVDNDNGNGSCEMQNTGKLQPDKPTSLAPDHDNWGSSSNTAMMSDAQDSTINNKYCCCCRKQHTQEHSIYLLTTL